MRYDRQQQADRMRKYGSVQWDDLGPEYQPKPRYDPIFRSNPPVRKARVVIAKTFDDLDPKNPWSQLAGTNMDQLPWE
jgi:hypothetical protein